MERLTAQMKQAEGITEQLKSENAMEWVQKMNNIRHRAERYCTLFWEIVLSPDKTVF